MMDILSLPGVRATNAGQLANDLYIVDAELLTKPTKCPTCGSTKLWEYGTRKVRYFDFKLHDRKTLINLLKQRYRCQEGGHTFTPSNDAFDPQFQLTSRVVRKIEKEAINRAFTSIADELSLDEKLVRNVFSRYAQKREKELNPTAGRILGIDELYLLRKYRCIFTNLEQRTVIDLLKKRTKPVVSRYLRQLPGIKDVERVCMDMWRPYWTACKEVMPKVPITVDKFHVLKEANLVMEKIRKETQKKLPEGERRRLVKSRFILLRRKPTLNEKELARIDQWRRWYPALIDAWELKEQFFNIYECTSPKEAERAFTGWVNDLPLTIHHQFRTLVTTVDNWRPEVFNYFDHRVTNAFTECANGIAKVANRTGRGYSFKVIRHKLLFAHELRKTPAASMTVRAWLNAAGISFSTFDHRFEDEP